MNWIFILIICLLFYFIGYINGKQIGLFKEYVHTFHYEKEINENFFADIVDIEEYKKEKKKQE